MDRTDWKGYILPLLFFKRISDVWDEETATAEEAYGDVDPSQFPEIHRFVVPEGCHWRDVRETASNVGAALQKAMRGIERANPDTLYRVFGSADWGNREKFTDELIKDMIEGFSAIELGNNAVDTDVLGDAYEYLVGKFADVKGARALLSERYAGLRRVAVGDYEPLEAYAEGPRIVADLRAGGVDVRSPMPHAALADLYRRTRVVVVPSQLQGGGERAVLEARRCGCEVHVFADNSKLAGLLKGPVPGAAEYATRLARGLACAAGDAGACAEACPRFQATAPAAGAAAGRRPRCLVRVDVPAGRLSGAVKPATEWNHRLVGGADDIVGEVVVAPRGQDARVAARAHCAALAGKRGWSELDDLVSCEVTVYAAVENARLAFLYHLDMAPSPHRDRALAAWAADRGPGTDRCFAES